MDAWGDSSRKVRPQLVRGVLRADFNLVRCRKKVKLLFKIFNLDTWQNFESFDSGNDFDLRVFDRDRNGGLGKSFGKFTRHDVEDIR